MAATATTIEETIELGGTDKLYLLKIVPTDSYNTGGETIDVAGQERFKRVLVPATGGYVFEFIPSSQKLKAYRQKDPANAGGADIPLPEVASTTNLSAAVLYGIGIGY